VVDAGCLRRLLRLPDPAAIEIRPVAVDRRAGRAAADIAGDASNSACDQLLGIGGLGVDDSLAHSALEHRTGLGSVCRYD